MERKRILKRLYGEPPKFDPGMVEELLRGMEMEETDFKLINTETLDARRLTVRDSMIIKKRPIFLMYSDYECKVMGMDGVVIGAPVNEARLEEYEDELFFHARSREQEEAVFGPDGLPIGGWFRKAEILPQDFNDIHIKVKQRGGFGDEGVLNRKGKAHGGWFYKVKTVRELHGEPVLLVENGAKTQVVGTDGKLVNRDITVKSDLYKTSPDEIVYVGSLLDDTKNTAFYNLAGEQRSAFADQFSYPIAYQDELYYAAKQDGKVFLFRGTERVSEEIKELESTCYIDEKPFFLANKGGKQAYLDINGEPVGGWFEKISYYYSINGQLYFVAEENNRKSLIGPNGERVVKDKRVIRDVSSVNGKLFYTSKLENPLKGRARFDETGTQVSERFSSSVSLGSGYAYVEDKANKAIMREDGSVLGGWFQKIEEHKIIDGECYFVGVIESKPYLIGPDGSVLARDYQQIDKLMIVNGELLFRTMDAKFKTKIRSLDRVIIEGESGTVLTNSLVVEDEPFFAVKKTDNTYQIIDAYGNDLPLEPYDKMFEMIHLGEGRMRVIGQRRGTIYMEDVQLPL